MDTVATASSVTLRIALASYGHTAALKRGAVDIEDVRPEFVEVQPIISAFRRMVRTLEFDVCEMAPATYLIAREAGAPFKALPVFLFRRFHHAGLAVRKDAGIRHPRELEGRRVGVRAWSVTTGIWTRGILAHEWGVDLGKIEWVVDDEEHVASLPLPPNVRRAPDGRSLAQLLDDGYLAAAFTGNAGTGRAGAPAQGWQGTEPAPTGHPELFHDAAALEADWYRRTGIYPIHSLVVVRDAVLERHPWIGRPLFDAFEASKARYLQALREGTAATDKDAHYREMAGIVGDPLPFGIEANRASIDAMIAYCHEQGLLRRRHAASDMFIDLGV